MNNQRRKTTDEIITRLNRIKDEIFNFICKNLTNH